MITRSKKLKSSEKDPESEERSNIKEIPVELEIEILKRLPVKSLGRFLLVSKLWATIIHSRDLIKRRLLVAFVDSDSQTRIQNWHFFSSSSSSTSFLSRGSCPFSKPSIFKPVEYRSNYVNGLICLGYGREQTICNLSTGKSITLPRVKTRISVVRSFFGYDLDNDQCKVLCTTEKKSGHSEPSYQHQVFTLGAKQKSWRVIDCSIPHHPITNGVCIDGVVYYLSYAGELTSLMRFNLKSEKLDIFDSSFPDCLSPTLISLSPTTLINYKGKVTAVTNIVLSSFDMWVMDQDAENHVWLKKSFSFEPGKSLLQRSCFSSICATHTGDFFLVPLQSHSSDEFYVYHYNPDKNSFGGVTIEVNGDYEFNPRKTRAVVF